MHMSCRRPPSGKAHARHRRLTRGRPTLLISSSLVVLPPVSSPPMLDPPPLPPGGGDAPSRIIKVPFFYPIAQLAQASGFYAGGCPTGPGRCPPVRISTVPQGVMEYTTHVCLDQLCLHAYLACSPSEQVRGSVILCVRASILPRWLYAFPVRLVREVHVDHSVRTSAPPHQS